MSFRLSPYDTTACEGISLRPIVDAIQKEFIGGNGVISNAPNSHVKEVIPADGYDNHVPVFAHPMVVDYTKDDKAIVIDGRMYLKYNRQTGENSVTSSIESYVSRTRGELTYIWATRGPGVVRDVSPLAMVAFASWLSDNIAKRFALGALEQYRLNIMAALFYQSNCRLDDDKIDEREQQRIAMAITRATRAKADDVFEIIEKLGGKVDSAAEFCEHAAEITESVRLKELNVGLLFGIVGGTWFGNNSREIAAVALEHPPTWIALCMAALSERSFRNTIVAKIIERNGAGAGRDFSLSVNRLLTDFARYQ